MAYTPTEWATGDVITAQKLNKMEQGIAGAGMQLYGPYHASGNAGSIAAGNVGVITCSDLTDENNDSVTYPSENSGAIMLCIGVQSPMAVSTFKMPHVQEDGWAEAQMTVINTSAEAAFAVGEITFYSTVEFPQES